MVPTRKRELGLSVAPNGQGMRVTAVQPGSVADELGIEPGDVVLTVHRWPVRSLDWWHLLRSGDDGSVRLEIEDGKTGARAVRFARLG
jgi:S1-C subfamily serine protease